MDLIKEAYDGTLATAQAIAYRNGDRVYEPMEIVHDAVANVIRWMHKHGKEPDNPASFLLAAVRNRAIDTVRIKRPAAHMPIQYYEESTADNERGNSFPPHPNLVNGDQEEQIINKLEAERAYNTLMALPIPDRQKQAILYSDIQGYSLAEAAEMLGTNVRAYQQVLYRARRTLKNRLKD